MPKSTQQKKKKQKTAKTPLQENNTAEREVPETENGISENRDETDMPAKTRTPEREMATFTSEPETGTEISNSFSSAPQPHSQLPRQKTLQELESVNSLYKIGRFVLRMPNTNDTKVSI